MKRLPTSVQRFFVAPVANGFGLFVQRTFPDRSRKDYSYPVLNGKNPVVLPSREEVVEFARKNFLPTMCSEL